MPGERRPSSPRIATFLAVESLSAIGSFATVLVKRLVLQPKT